MHRPKLRLVNFGRKRKRTIVLAILVFILISLCVELLTFLGYPVSTYFKYRIPTILKGFRLIGSRPLRIPKHIWTYWDDTEVEIPKTVSALMRRWQDLHPEYTFTLLYPDTVELHVSVRLPKNYWLKTMRKRRSDWARLAVLMEHGGVWLDAGVLLTGGGKGLNDILNVAWEQQRETVVFYDKMRTKQVIGNGANPNGTDFLPQGIDPFFVASVPWGTFISAWFLEFNMAFRAFHCETSYMSYLQISIRKQTFELVCGGREWDSQGDLALSVSGDKVLAYDSWVRKPLFLESSKISDRWLWECSGDEIEMAKRLLGSAEAWKKGEMQRLRWESEDMMGEEMPWLVRIRSGTLKALETLVRVKVPISDDSVYRRLIAK
ncbi:hypothetical protein HDU97_004033 [Phlyctochytrium planicorne]|nr:hypothetical protein HDU97_004033 [Phlyctochytrium planicorne]